MKKTLPWFLLAVSLGFNVFFVIGYVQAHRTLDRLKTPDGMMELIAERLKLDGAQTQAFDAERRKMEAALLKLKDSTAGGVDEFWAAAGADQPDRDKVRALVERLRDAKAREVDIRVEMMMNQLAVLQPEQRAKYLQMARGKSVLAE